MRRKVFQAIVLLCMALLLWGCGGGGGGSWVPSNLFAVVVGVDSSYTSGNLSTVDLTEDGGFRVVRNIVSNLCGDTIVKTFGDYVFVIERPSWGTVRSPIKVYRVGSWASPLANYTLGKNVYDIAFVNENVAYVISWGEDYIEKVNPITGDSLKHIDISSYSYGSDNSPNAAKGLIVGGKLFVILQRFDIGSFDYGDGKVVAIDTNSDSLDGAINLSGKNPSDMEYYDGKLYIIETGKFFDPSDDLIDVIDIRSRTVSKLCDNPLRDYGMDLYGLEITEDGKAFLLGAGWPNYKVYKIDLSSGRLLGEVYVGGYITSIKYDRYSGYLLIADRGSGQGDGKLVIYDVKRDEIMREISEEDLGYPPYSVDISAFD